MGFIIFCLLYFTVTVAFFLIGLLVVLRQNNAVYKNFAAFCFLIGVWQLVQLISQIFYKQQDLAVLFLRVSVVTAPYMILSFLFFALAYVNKRPSYKLGIVIATVSAVVSLFSPGLIGARVSQFGISISSVDIYYGTVILFGGVCAVWGLGLIFHHYLHGERERRQHDLALLFGVFQATVSVLTISVFSTPNSSSQIIVPISCLIAVGIIAYAIIFQRLFDIRAVVARSLAYVVTVATLALIYGALIYGVAKLLFHLDISLWVQAFLSIGTGVVALTFQQFKKTFDKFTNKIFYQDAYDPQELFGHLNQVLVSSLNLNYLLKETAKIIAENLKAESVLFGLNDESQHTYRVIGTQHVDYELNEAAKIQHLARKVRQGIIIVDYLTDQDNELKSILEANHIAVLVRLSPNAKRAEEGLGYLVLGPKKSGSAYTQQDVRVLNTVANELIIAIQNALHFEEIQRFNVTLQSRVDEATRQLRRTNQKLEQLDETKDDFISMASHQLRTPLTSVKGYISMVLEGDAGKINETQKKMLGQAFISSQRMVYLIADLLNVSRLKTGKFVIDAVPTNLSKIISEEVAQLVETAESRSIELTYKPPAAFPTLPLDETKIRQVIMNFIDNAIYYTPSGGHIRVELSDTPSSVELRVTDDGIGVPKPEQHHLFTKFYRAGNARKARPDGTGLGLFMAKKVVVAQGGAIIFESKEGQGSTFGFSFPKSRLQALMTTLPPKTAASASSKKAAATKA